VKESHDGTKNDLSGYLWFLLLFVEDEKEKKLGRQLEVLRKIHRSNGWTDGIDECAVFWGGMMFLLLSLSVAIPILLLLLPLLLPYHTILA
jgi:hypothetical protein